MHPDTYDLRQAARLVYDHLKLLPRNKEVCPVREVHFVTYMVPLDKKVQHPLQSCRARKVLSSNSLRSLLSHCPGSRIQECFCAEEDTGSAPSELGVRDEALSCSSCLTCGLFSSSSLRKHNCHFQCCTGDCSNPAICEIRVNDAVGLRHEEVLSLCSQFVQTPSQQSAYCLSTESVEYITSGEDLRICPFDYHFPLENSATGSGPSSLYLLLDRWRSRRDRGRSGGSSTDTQPHQLALQENRVRALFMTENLHKRWSESHPLAWQDPQYRLRLHPNSSFSTLPRETRVLLLPD